MPNVIVEDRRTTAHYLVSEANGYRSREQIIVAAGARLKAGTVMGRVAATGKYKAWDGAAADGSEHAAAILFDEVDAVRADARGVITARDSEVLAEALVWPEGTTDTAKNAELARLAGAGIIAR